MSKFDTPMARTFPSQEGHTFHEELPGAKLRPMIGEIDRRTEPAERGLHSFDGAVAGCAAGSFETIANQQSPHW